MARGPPAPQIVIVERRQIIMNQRISVQHFQTPRPVLRSRGGNDPATMRAGLDAKHGPQALAAGKQAVAHGFVDRLRMLRLQRNQPVQRRVGQLLPLFESFLQHEAVSITRRRMWEMTSVPER